MLQQIIRNEWRLWRRDGRTGWLLATIAALGLLAWVLQLHDTSKKAGVRQAAQQASRTAWLLQGEKHPHIAAHFGNYAYKRPSVLTVFDPGLTMYTGTSVYMEPHRQNDFLLSESAEQNTGARFGWFTPTFVCQLLVPLLIILLTFNLVVSDKQAGTYAVYLAQGASTRQVIFGKAAAAFLLFAGFITAYLLLAGCGAFLMAASVFPLASLLYLWLAYLVYYAVWCGTGILVSSLAKTAGAAVSLLLLFWIVTGVILPRWAAGAGENLHPLVTNYAFKKKVAEDIANGINGHDLQSDRARRMEDSVLKAAHADSVQQLPFNLEGYIMQRGEEYSSRVYDMHFSRIYAELENQRRVQSLFALASPPMLLRNLSMAAANASLETEIVFQQDAEKYRRHFVQAMNSDMMLHSTYGNQGWDQYKVKKSLYGDIHDFEAPTRPLRWRLYFVEMEQLFLLLWLLLTAGALAWISRKNYR